MQERLSIIDVVYNATSLRHLACEKVQGRSWTARHMAQNREKTKNDNIELIKVQYKNRKMMFARASRVEIKLFINR